MVLRNWVMIIVSVVIGIVALFTAAGTADPTTYDIGLFVFVLAIGFIFFIIKRSFDQTERGLH